MLLQQKSISSCGSPREEAAEQTAENWTFLRRAPCHSQRAAELYPQPAGKRAEVAEAQPSHGVPTSDPSCARRDLTGMRLPWI